MGVAVKSMIIKDGEHWQRGIELVLEKSLLYTNFRHFQSDFLRCSTSRLKKRKYDEVNDQDIQTNQYNDINLYLKRLNGAVIKTTSPMETVSK